MAQYLSYFNLQSIPFRNAPDARFFVALDHPIQVESAILSSLSGGHGLAVLIGDVGSGKTTLTHHLIESLPKDTHVFWLAYPPETPDELYNFILRDLGVTSPPTGRTLLLDEIRTVLMREALQCTYLLVVDEAHYSNDAVLDALKFLNNLEGHGGKLLQILLVAQKELLPLLRKPRHASLVQRIACLRRMSRLTPYQSIHYVKSRLEKAGGSLRVFTPSALKLLLKKAEGLPRRINNLCHEAMLGAFFRNSPLIEVDDVLRAALSLSVGSNPASEAQAKSRTGSSTQADRAGSQLPIRARRFGLFRYALVLGGGLLIITMLALLVRNGFTPIKRLHPVAPNVSDGFNEPSFPANSLRLGLEHGRVEGGLPVGNGTPDLKSETQTGGPHAVPDVGEAPPDFEGKTTSPDRTDSFWGVAGSLDNHFFSPFTVQVGTFVTEEQSMDAFWFWQAKGYPVYQHLVQRDAATTRYVVRLGGFDTMEEAAEAAKLFNRREGEQAIPVSVADRSPTSRTVMFALPVAPKGNNNSNAMSIDEADPIAPGSSGPFRPGGPEELYHLLAKGRVQTHAMTAGAGVQGGNERRSFERGFIEVAVLEDREVAELLVDRFEVAAGLSASVFTVGMEGKVRHRVLVGPFASPEEAVRVQADARSALEGIN